MAEQVARSVTVHGRVQGVYFRQTTARVARSLDVVGWVSNEPDGTVLAHVEGPADAVEQVLRFVAHGPPEASVDSVDTREVAVERLSSFEVR